jgi:hypothetical protein
VRKCESAVTASAPVPRKTLGKHGRMRKSFHSEGQPSAQELALAKPVKCSNKFVVKSIGLRVAEKATITVVKIAGKKTCSASAGESGVTRALACALDLFGSGSLASDNEATPQEPSHKRPMKFPLPKGVPKSSVVKGNFE